MSNFKRRLEELASLAFFEMVRAWLAPVVSAFAVYLHATHKALFDRYKLWIGLVIGYAVGAVVRAVWRRIDNRPNLPKVESDFAVKSKEITFEYLNRTSATYTKRIQLKALRSGLRDYPDRYRWTGGSVEMKSEIPGQTVRNTIKDGVWQWYAIDFPKFLMKDEEVDTTVIFTLGDEKRTAVPFISATIDEPTDRLKMTLIFPDGFGITQCICEISATMSSKTPIESAVKRLEHNQVTWEPKPRLSHHYKMKWVLPEERNHDRANSATSSQ